MVLKKKITDLGLYCGQTICDRDPFPMKVLSFAIPDKSICNEFGYLPLRDDCVVEIKTTILPLDRAVQIQNIT